jgi:O-antigen biosynthesis protein
MALRITTDPVRVHHIPLVLYDWRRHAGSTAASPLAKPYTQAAGRRALEDALAASRTAASVSDGSSPNTYYVIRKIRQNPLVSIVICSRNPKLLKRSLRSLGRHTAYRNREVVIVRHEDTPNRAFDDVLPRFGARGVSYSDSFHFSKMNNLGAEESYGEIPLFLNDDIQAIQQDWLGHVVGHLERPEVGVVGAKLLYGSGGIQHAGIVTAMGDRVEHAGRCVFASAERPWLNVMRNVSAVTGACLGIRRYLFPELGGFDPQLPANYNHVELCLRA